MQRRPLIGSEFGPLGYFFTVGDPDADVYIVKDINKGDPAGNWRWTQQHAELRFLLPTLEHLQFTTDFSIAEAIFRDTGPVTLAFTINGNLLDRVRYDKPGDEHFQKPVPAAWLKARAENRVLIESDKSWAAKDGTQMILLLIRAGFIQ